MISKPVNFALFIFLFVQALYVAKCEDTKTTDSSNTLEEQVCSLSQVLEPFAPWSHELASDINNSGNDAEVFIKQLKGDCLKMRARTATEAEKEATANGIRNFVTNSRNMIANMTLMVSGGGQIMDQFFAVADKLSPATEK